MEKIPDFSKDLIDMLDREYPERCPRATDNEREIWMYSGTRNLINNLLYTLNPPDEDYLDDPGGGGGG